MPARPSRVGLIGPLPPPSGGMANQTRQLARLLGDSGIHVEVVQVNAPYRPAWMGRVRGVRALVRLFPYLTRLWATAGRVDVFHVMANSGWSWHLFAAPAVWIGWLRRIPVVINYRGGEAENFFARSFRWVAPTLHRAAAVVVPSAFLEKVFAQRGVSTRIVPNIVDLSRFFPRSTQRSAPLADPKLVVARNLEAIYDVATALQVFHVVKARLPAATLTIAGSGPELGSLRTLAKELGVEESVSFTGRLDNDAMADLYRASDVVLNTSLVDNMPISILEAMACGVPVVSTNVGGIPFLVTDGREAMLAPPGDVAALADATITVLTRDDLRRRLIAAGQAKIEGFAWSSVSERLLSVYEAVVAE
ncbi:MAG: glycosyltransferase family 4 protein [Gammaproteobacteria bacterium]